MRRSGQQAQPKPHATAAANRYTSAPLTEEEDAYEHVGVQPRDTCELLLIGPVHLDPPPVETGGQALQGRRAGVGRGGWEAGREVCVRMSTRAQSASSTCGRVFRRLSCKPVVERPAGFPLPLRHSPRVFRSRSCQTCVCVHARAHAVLADASQQRDTHAARCMQAMHKRCTMA